MIWKLADGLNTPLYPPTVGPERVYVPEVSATPDELAVAATAAERQRRRPPRFDRPVFDPSSVRLPHTYAPFPPHLPEDSP